MDNNLPIVYLSIFVGLLGVSGWFLFRQILKTRRVESSLGRLESKLTKEKGTAQEYYELGSIYLEKKLYIKAIAQFQKALRCKDLKGEEDTAVVYNALGFAHFSQEQYDMAIRQYKEAIKFKPDYVTALNNLGHAYERKKLTSSALEIYEESLKYEPNNDTAKRRSESLRRRVVTTS